MFFEGEELLSGVTSIDYKTPVTLRVCTLDKSKSKEYKVYVYTFTGLPIVWINTTDKQEITSKEEYIDATIKIEASIGTPSIEDNIEQEVKIRGRGNRTWLTPQKSYRLKFEKKVSVLGEPSDKSWVLLPNYDDKTMLRIQTGFFMSKISNLVYTPRMHHVELMLNGQYNGTYLLGENNKISNDRVNIDKSGFLLEVDAHAPSETDSRYFAIQHSDYRINIKAPDVEYYDENFNYARDYLLKAENVLFSDIFKDPQNGWRKYLDGDSFVDWYLINLIARNVDAMYSSSFMHFERDGKIVMGPLWDFDQAFGSEKAYAIDVTSFRNDAWFQRLLEDPDFAKNVKNRFNYFYSRKNDIINYINKNASYLKYSAIENNHKWHILYNYVWNNNEVWGCYFNEVQSMKIWIDSRFEWLKHYYNDNE